MTKIIVLSLTDLQAARLREMADFEGESVEGMIKTLIIRGFHRYEAESAAIIAEVERQHQRPPLPERDAEPPE